MGNFGLLKDGAVIGENSYQVRYGSFWIFLKSQMSQFLYMLTAPEERQRISWSMSWHTLNIKNIWKMTLLLGFACDGAKISKQEHLHKSGPTAHEVIKR